MAAACMLAAEAEQNREAGELEASHQDTVALQNVSYRVHSMLSDQ